MLLCISLAPALGMQDTRAWVLHAYEQQCCGLQQQDIMQIHAGLLHVVAAAVQAKPVAQHPAAACPTCSADLTDLTDFMIGW